ncbi:acyloxyacyl hydrolase [Gemmatimonas groenlandica]|uniref:Acyloxyacyl hydrolase n=1 Tax=Gemmatimonas groenlandica TaxID=2732249 RepID=A0A6M4IKZ5_9BACT|nr:acyloxyacyl hydrolase [Gemmatimonas groenlandica]QJR35704.1 acyloxyacyl hydrolase [Gemmatimonas groenlandica]
MSFPVCRALSGAALVALLPVLVPSTARAQGAPQRPHVSVMLSDAVDTRTASHNETIDGAFRTLAVQVSRPLFSVGGMHVAWLGEIMPVMLVTAGAPPNRIPTPITNPTEANDPRRLARYAVRDAYGVGFAPLGAEAAYSLGAKTHFLFNVTSGVAWFSRVVPYGKATQANFTVAPGLFLERRIGSRQALALGYQLHHLSNASMGGANPGMNSHIFSVRVSKLR